jgi:hypothetical protein
MSLDDEPRLRRNARAAGLSASEINRLAETLGQDSRTEQDERDEWDEDRMAFEDEPE